MQFNVFAGQTEIGTLVHDASTNRFSWHYADSWLANANRFALSPEIPLAAPQHTADQHSAVVRQFFENLLPEGEQLDDVAAAYKVSKSSLAGLLAAVGKETAGALRILPAGETSRVDRPTKRALSRAELSQRIRERDHLPFSVWDGRIRLSLAGVQDKIAVLQEGEEWFLTEGKQLASTHILKPEPKGDAFRGLVTNEYFCMQLAKAVGLPAADTAIVFVPEPVLLVTRFDRDAQLQDGRVDRLHVIDGCQALGISTALKYERQNGDAPDVMHMRDGASLPKFFKLISQEKSRFIQKTELLRWVIFQVLIGNCDAHAKNISFFCDVQGLRLAPAYDLVCTLAYPKLSNTLSMAVGDAFALADVVPYEWANFAYQCDLPFAHVGRELERLAKLTLQVLPSLTQQAIKAGADEHVCFVLQDIISRRCLAQAGIAPHVREVDSSLF